MWLRLYTDILNDPKIQLLKPEWFKGWINLLCLAGDYDGMLPPMDEIAWCLRLTEPEATALVAVLTEHGLLLTSSTGPKVRDWDKWQPSSMRADRLLQGDWATIRLDVLVRDSWECQYCGAQATAVDHIIARSRGGTNDMDNLVAVCKPCNSRKRDRTPEEAGMRLKKYAHSQELQQVSAF